MPRWLAQIVPRIHELAARRRVRFTLKARRELAATGLGLDADDAIEILRALRPPDSTGRLVSSHTGEWRYTFKPRVGEVVLYLKLAIRADCIMVSFHEDRQDDEDEDE